MAKTIGIYQYNVKTTMKLIFGADKTPHVMCQIEEEIFVQQLRQEIFYPYYIV